MSVSKQTLMTVTLIFKNIVYILDDLNALPDLSRRADSVKLSSMSSLSAEHSEKKPAPMSTSIDAEATRASASHTKLRVLFVEDNDFVRDLTMCLLEADDREVVAFASAEEAYEEFTHNPFDIVITDVSLPKMSGIELTKRLAAIAPDTWFVIASGYQLPPGIEKLGAHVRAITKPFESDKVDVIFSEMRALLGAART